MKTKAKRELVVSQKTNFAPERKIKWRNTK